MRRFACAVVLLLTPTLASADPPAAAPPAAPVAAEVKPFQGFWKPESVQYNGAEQLADPKQRALLTLVVKAADYRVYVAKDAAGDQHLRLLTAELTADPAAKTFTLTIKEGEKKGAAFHGIYEVAGSKLRLCYGPAAKPRPTAFAALKGTDTFLEVWTPEKR